MNIKYIFSSIIGSSLLALFFLSAIIIPVPSIANAAGNEISTTLNLQDLAWTGPQEVPTINVLPNTTYTITLSVFNNVLLGGEGKVSITSFTARLPGSIPVGGPVVCPSNWEEYNVPNNGRGVGSINCVESNENSRQYDITYGQTGNVTFTFTTPSSAGTTDLSLPVSYIKSNGLTQYTTWSPALHVSVSIPVCTSWTYSSWSSCSSDGSQTRSVISSSPNSCTGGNPVISQSCTYHNPSCISFSYSDWGECKKVYGGGENEGYQNRDVTAKYPTDCQGGSTNPDSAIPQVTQLCKYIPSCTVADWSCGSWGTCSQNGNQKRTCEKISNCQGGIQSATTSQSCTPPQQSKPETPVTPPIYQPPQPNCSADTWTCGDWNTCSLSGIQSRSCKKTFDCSSVEDAVPSTSRSCAIPSQQIQDQNESINREQIFRATVKLECPTQDGKFYSQGSGTVIDRYGTILTNRHVILGTIGSCHVGFINDENDIPSFVEIADVKKISSDQSSNGDMALLKIRNSRNKQFTAINILEGDSNNLKSGDTILPFGYPDENLFGTTITFTEGPYSGKGTTLNLGGYSKNVSGFFKTTATVDHGNSGGGAYQKKSGLFMGIPTLGTSLDPKIPSRVNYILSINTIKTWLSSLGESYNVSANNYSNLGNSLSSSVKIEDLNLSSLRALDAPTSVEIISDKIEEKNKEIITKKTTGQPQTSQPQRESTIVESETPAEEKANDSVVKISVQRRSVVANAVQEISDVAERSGGIGEEIKTIAQTQTQNQEKIETGLQKIQNRGGLTKFFIGPNYGEIKASQKLLEQNKEQIQKLNELGGKLSGKGDKKKIEEQIQLLEQTAQQIEASLSDAKKGFSLFGWMFRLFQ